MKRTLSKAGVDRKGVSRDFLILNNFFNMLESGIKVVQIRFISRVLIYYIFYCYYYYCGLLFYAEYEVNVTNL